MQLVEALFSYNDDDKKGIMLLHAIMTLLMNAASKHTKVDVLRYYYLN